MFIRLRYLSNFVIRSDYKTINNIKIITRRRKVERNIRDQKKRDHF